VFVFWQLVSLVFLYLGVETDKELELFHFSFTLMVSSNFLHGIRGRAVGMLSRFVLLFTALDFVQYAIFSNLTWKSGPGTTLVGVGSWKSPFIIKSQTKVLRMMMMVLAVVTYWFPC
jgi:hypothetical protein